jgi:hypothetical protein
MELNEKANRDCPLEEFIGTVGFVYIMRIAP